MEELFTVGELARRAGVNIQTIHYYERRELILPVGRRESGYRVYDDETLKRLLFIRHAKELGFTLEEIRGLLDLSIDDTVSCDSVRDRARHKLRDVEEKIKGLESIRKILKKLVDACNKRRPTEKCPILKSIEEESLKNKKG